MRLTLEEVTLNNSNRKEFSHFSDLLDQEQKELIEYKTLEQELGIDLLIFVKAILIGFYYKDVSSHNIPYIGFARGKRIDKNYFRVNNHPFYFKDYGKTWALTKEELL